MVGRGRYRNEESCRTASEDQVEVRGVYRENEGRSVSVQGELMHVNFQDWNRAGHDWSVFVTSVSSVVVLFIGAGMPFGFWAFFLDLLYFL